MKALKILSIGFLISINTTTAQDKPVDDVNPFIGTSNFGATHPGAIAPRGMASVSPFNVAGKQNVLEKDSRWLSNPYVNENTFLTGFTHVNLSGVGCPDLGVIITMPTTGELETDHLKYGTAYTDEVAKAGYYSVNLPKYKVKAEATASTRTGVTRYTFPEGRSNILLNLGLGLTNEQGAMVKVVSPTEIEGMRTVGSFCYNSPEHAYPVYFVARFSKPADEFGIWKKPATYEGEEAQWMTYNGKTRMMKGFTREVIGDSIGAYFSYNLKKSAAVEMKIGVSYVSIANARENLEKETGGLDFDKVYERTKKAWNEKLSKIEVEGGTKEDRTIFYTALYHTLIHPNIFNDINGEYPEISTGKIGKTDNHRYTVFSLWDTYRNYHQFMSMVYPGQQLEMVKNMLDMYDENGWLPKWELNSTETFTMVGDPASVVLADTYLRGLTDFDVEKAYEAMKKSATQLENNPLRPALADYLRDGYVNTSSLADGVVSTTQEYNVADYAIARLARALGKKEDYRSFYKRSLSYRKLFDKKLKLLRPRNADGSWYEPFDPVKGANFEKNMGFIEGNAWQYVFMLTHDAKGMIKLMGGKKDFEAQLDHIFDNGHYDMANEPDIAYGFLYNYIKGSEWKAQKRIRELLDTYYKNAPDGLPGNDDTGTMSAWAIYSMMGIYPITPANPEYTFVVPRFSKITIHLDIDYYKKDKLVITCNNPGESRYIDKIQVGGKEYKGYFISDEALLNAGEVSFRLKEND
ncbi:GH92 family glycosyl hydrolase [Sinomicrobium weinanense]|uniref:Glycoside hydrolase family 92 protein n=1 Tax=Sinomicrobium weinanense TaxID=2842200 RepID=A0A926Q1V5_9FLAO|nr:GH92 family glycosyl hydrolase [Sinomicrobium weinanense]MBC9795938.1 glycoside hydrolase family 92 protein [Sinomicrobium weinanense]MBU3124683.1 GH92 family glycosyl hydrolase [Sinomicrobium weinanense]